MRDRADILADLAVHVGELTKPIRHVAIYQIRDKKAHRTKDHFHSTLQPSLLDQLRAHMASAPVPEESQILRVYESKPPLHSDSLDALIRIKAWSARLLNVKYRKPLRATVEENLRGLVGVAAGLTDPELADLAREIRSWHTWAQTITEWVRPPWRPSVPCPLCEAPNALRVNLEAKTAVCVSCGERWDRDNIGILAEHVRSLSDEWGTIIAG